MEGSFPMDQVEGVAGGGGGDGFGMIQANYIYYALYSYYCGSAGKESAHNTGHLGSIPGLGRSPGKGKGYPLQYSGLENSMNCIDREVAESDMTEGLSLSLISIIIMSAPLHIIRHKILYIEDPC